jgi:hypothetical protein
MAEYAQLKLRLQSMILAATDMPELQPKVRGSSVLFAMMVDRPHVLYREVKYGLPN